MELFQSEQFGKHVEELLEKWHVPGLAIAITNAVGDVQAKAFGYATFNKENDPEAEMTMDHIFDMASCSKSLTAAAVAKLIADSEASDQPIEWTTPVQSLLPDDFVLPDATATALVTIEDILSHRSGMPDHSNSYLGIHAATPDTPRSITRNLRNLSMTAPLRSKFQYSNDMYIVATHLIETLSSQSFGEFLQHNILDVLGMTSTFLQPSAVKAARQEHRLAKPYIWDDDTESYRELPLAEQPEAQGAGSIQSTVLDYAKWAQALLKQDERLFSAETYAELCKPRILMNPEDNEEDLAPFTSHDSYALGLAVSWYRGHRIVQHDGSIFGYGAKLLFMPAHDFGLVICANTDGDVSNEVAEILAMELVDEVLGVPQLADGEQQEQSSKTGHGTVPGPTSGRVDWAKLKWEEAQEEPGDEEKREEIVHDLSLRGLQPLTLPLTAYVGTYHNVGYHEIRVDIVESRLDANLYDRSDPFQLYFEHVCENTDFVVKQVFAIGGGEYLKASFQVGENDVVEAMGIDLVEEMEGNLVWFERAESSGEEKEVH